VAPVSHVPVAPLPPERFAAVFGSQQYAAFRDLVAQAGPAMEGRAVWSVNSTARGGGVAELLRSLIAYARGGGIDARWAVIEGDREFFRVTKRLHNYLHGSEGDGGGLGAVEGAAYERTLARSAEELGKLVQPEDIVILHDPQTAGLTHAVKRTGARVIWRAHVGLDLPNERAREAWRFLLPYISEADAYVFSRKAFVWDGLDHERITIIPPSIDAFSPKNEDLSPQRVLGILHAAGLVRGGGRGVRAFTRLDGTPGRVERRARLVEHAPLAPDDRVVLQVSRWDRLKDPIGVLRGFAEHVAPLCDAHLVLAGPAVAAVADDPEGPQVWREAVNVWAALDAEVRRRAHLVTLPMADTEENAAIVNALQRHAMVIVQKSLAEGFGLTVSEAMWKGKPVIASAVGGMQDQVVDGVTGRLLPDPRDLAGFGDAVLDVIGDERAAGTMGQRGRERVLENFLGPRQMTQYFELFGRLMEPAAAATPA
jgi:trehalose synthase